MSLFDMNDPRNYPEPTATLKSRTAKKSIADCRVTVLISGPPGAGKSKLARLLIPWLLRHLPNVKVFSTNAASQHELVDARVASIWEPERQ